MQIMGDQGVDALQKRVEQKILSNLIDDEEDLAREQQFESKKHTLQQLLEAEGPDRRARDFQTQSQPSSYLKEVNLQHQKDSMSPQRKLVTSEFGKNLIVDIGKSKKVVQGENSDR